MIFFPPSEADRFGSVRFGSILFGVRFGSARSGPVLPLSVGTLYSCFSFFFRFVLEARQL